MRRLSWLAVGGVLSALAIYGGGLLLERAPLGADPDAIAARVERETRSSIATAAGSLRTAAGALAGEPALAQGATADNPDAIARLFAAAGTAIGGETALTVYNASGTPIAWGGRPSDLPPDRLAAAQERWFFTRGDLGLRLLYVMPVLDPAGVRRLATVVAERAMAAPAGVRPAPDPVVRLDAGIVPVSVIPEGAPEGAGHSFTLTSPSGEPLGTAIVSWEDVRLARLQWRCASLSLALISLAAALLLCAGPLLDWRQAARTPRQYAAAASLLVATIVVSRVLLLVASPGEWAGGAVFSSVTYASAQLRPLLASPFEFALTGLAAGAVVALVLHGVEASRIARRRARRTVGARAVVAGYLAAQGAAGILLAAMLHGYHGFVVDTLRGTTLDLLHFSVHPLQSGTDVARVVLQLGLVVWHAAALGFGVAMLRGAGIFWRVPRFRWGVRAAAIGCWVTPLGLLSVTPRVSFEQILPMAVIAAAVTLLAGAATRLKARYRRGSQGFRLVMLLLALTIPALAVYPDVFQVAWRAKAQLIESRFAPQAINQRDTIRRAVQDSLIYIDTLADLSVRVERLSGAVPAFGGVDTDLAFGVWRNAALATPVTSSLELYGGDGALVSRFAFNLPDDLTAVAQRETLSCDWNIYEEVSPFFADERIVLHAGRALCVDGRAAGSIVVHAMLDYSDLPFISSRSPYIAMLRREEAAAGEAAYGRDIEYAVYGWSRTPIYASRDPAWPMSDGVFTRTMASRSPFWAELRRGGDRYDVYVMNDRGGIHALGFPVVDIVGHLVNTAEITALAFVAYAALLALSLVFGLFGHRGGSARALLLEVRASFYWKLFLAFVLSALVPGLALAFLTRAYMAGQIRESIESEAVRTASSARRVVEDLIVPRAEQQGATVDDNLMVWVSRLVGEDVNVFVGPRVSATSQRNLFASGLLPARTPPEVYRDLTLRMQASTVWQERIGDFEYLVVGTPMTATGRGAMLTVPLTLRQQVIQSEIDTLDRRVLLAVLLFILAGAAIGYSMAERIADPVNRLTRATRRIAAGDFDARIAATSSDELRRLVQAFNAMASDLQRQRAQLERTNRLEAWAEMARQVAHEIKNPLTPIQLNAEHLRRVHADRGEPMSPVLQECVDTILQQVRLLRQIASEFSSFASSPTAKPTDVGVEELLLEVVAPYRAGLGDRLRFVMDVRRPLPPVRVDRTLTARALTNVIENGVHAMPAAGELRIIAEARSEAGGVPQTVAIRVADTGRGMDAEAMARAFEPYFSTKGAGTGLGLPIAKRYIELSGGTIAITSERDRGTTVEIALPVA